MVLDLMEPFRASVVDRTVVGLLNKGWLPTVGEDGFMAGSEKRRMVESLTERFESKVRYGGKQIRLRNVLQMHARMVAQVLLGRGAYQPFRAGW